MLVEPTVVELGARELVCHAINEHGNDEHNVLIEEVVYEIAVPSVGLSTVHHHEASKVAELGNGIVR